MAHSNFNTELPDLVQKYLSDALEQVESQADHTKCLVGWEKRAGVELQTTDKIQEISKGDVLHRWKGLNRP